MKKHLNIRVEGLVQGVFFRKNTMVRATSLGLCGFVMNLPDGSVYIEVEGEPEVLEELVHWCEVGPTQARVDRVSVEEGVVVEASDFIIRN